MTIKETKLGAHIPLIYHCEMLKDKQRMENFREAINSVVKEGDKVLELGGGTGVMSFYASKKASKVYCVEQIPENAKHARKFLDLNGSGNKVEVICEDAFNYLPPEPVDVVICEMIHVGMLREKQIQMIESFKQRYRNKFGEKLPRFIPEAFIQAVQLVEYDFNFFDYNAPVPLFQIPGDNSRKCIELGDPVVFQTEEYQNQVPLSISVNELSKIKQSGNVNAIRMILKNALAILPEENRGIFWHNQYLVLPIEKPLNVELGQEVKVSFAYEMGAEIEDMIESISVSLR